MRKLRSLNLNWKSKSFHKVITPVNCLKVYSQLVALGADDDNRCGNGRQLRWGLGLGLGLCVLEL